MKRSDALVFPPFRIDLVDEQLWRETRALELRPKAFAVLRYLVQHGGRLVTKSELLDAVWSEAVVGEAVLKTCIREIRAALADDAQAPRYIATVHRRGYRFIAPCVTADESKGPQLAPTDVSGLRVLPSRIVGREAELAQLQQRLAATCRGE